MQTIDLALLRNFTILAASGSISQTAQQVGRTQSAVTMQMQRLEAQLGQVLLTRSASGMRLTSQGEQLFQYANALLAQHDEMLAALSNQSIRGRVTLGCPEDYTIALLPQMLRAFLNQYPEVELNMVCQPSTELKPMLDKGQIDLALLSQADLSDTKILRKERLVWVGQSRQPELLQAQSLPLALSAPTTLDHRAAIDAMTKAERRFRVAFASNSLAGLVALARSGHAISVITETAVPDDLVILDEELPALPQIGILLQYAQGKSPAAVRALGDYICERLPLIPAHSHRR